MAKSIKNKLLAIFIRFLKEKDVYSQFMNNFNSLESCEWRRCHNRYNARYYDIVSLAFPWDIDDNSAIENKWLLLDLDWKQYIDNNYPIYGDDSFKLIKEIK